MRRSVLALGLDPKFADFTQMPGLTPEAISAYIDSQLERLRELGYDVVSCLTDAGATAESVAARVLATQDFNCVVMGAGLRAPAHFLLFEKLINVVHAWAPGAKICFNTSPADTVEAVRRWLPT